MEKQKNMPQLRFPEFSEEWRIIKLGDVSVVKTGDKDTQNKVEDGNYPFYVRSDKIERINSYSFDGEAILTSGDGVGVGKNFHYINGKFDFHQRVYSIRDFNNEISGKYVYYYFAERFYKRVIRVSAKNSVDSVRMDMITDMPIPFPSLPEQLKIASFFTAIDQKINQLKRKVNLLEHYKKGVMQKIFSQEIRFKEDDGQVFPEWEKKKFVEIYSFKNTNSFSRENLNYENGTVKNIHYGDIHTKFDTLLDITKEDIPYVNEDLPVYKISAQNYCKEGDLVFADASEDLADVGKSIELVNLNNETVLSGLHTILARPDLSKIAIGFGGYLMKSNDIRKQIMKEAQGSKVSSISATKLSCIQLNIPVPEEQSKIANFLSAIDDKINQTQIQIAKAEVWKKGLMQQMFV